MNSTHKIWSLKHTAVMWWGMLVLHGCQSTLSGTKDPGELPVEKAPLSQMHRQNIHERVIDSPDSANTMISTSSAGTSDPLQRTASLSADMVPHATPGRSITSTKKRPVQEIDPEPVFIKRQKETPPSHSHWFNQFVQATDQMADPDEAHEASEAWEEIDRLLQEGAPHGFLKQSVIFPNDGPAAIQECTALHYAAAKGISKLVTELIMKYKVPVNIPGAKCLSTPLHLAASRGHLEIVKLLVKHGADITSINEAGESVLHYAAAGANNEHGRDVIEYLVREEHVDFKQKSNEGDFWLSLAVFNANIPVIEYWVDTYVHHEDPEIDILTKQALGLAKYKHGEKSVNGEARMLQSYIIRTLKDFLKSRTRGVSKVASN